MLKNIGIVLSTLILASYTLTSFAIAPGAGQAQINNNMQQMQQNKQHIQQMKQNQKTYHQNNTSPSQKMQRQAQ
jgi:hypothetical protein